MPTRAPDALLADKASTKLDSLVGIESLAGTLQVVSELKSYSSHVTTQGVTEEELAVLERELEEEVQADVAATEVAQEWAEAMCGSMPQSDATAARDFVGQLAAWLRDPRAEDSEGTPPGDPSLS